MPQLLRQIRKNAPSVGLEVHPLFTEDYESDLRLQRYDLIIDMPPRGRTVLKVEPVFSERLMVVCSAEHPRIHDACSVEQFLAEEHVVVSRWHARKSLMNEEDIADLVMHFLDQIAVEYGSATKKIEADAIKLLQNYEWTGNIRELRNVVERLVILSGESITGKDVETYASF